MSIEAEVTQLRDDVDRLMRQRNQAEEIKHQVWNDMQQEIYRLCKKTDDRIAALEASVDHRFEVVDKRFEQVDKRFKQVDQRFDAVDKRFDKLESDVADIKELLLAHFKRT